MADVEESGFIERRAFLKGSLESIGMRYGILVVGFIGSVLIARAIGASGRGAYAFVVTLATTAFSVAHLSVEQAFVALWSRRPSSDLVGSGAIIATVSGIGAAIVTAVVIWPGLDMEVPRGATAWMVVIGLGTIPLSIASLYGDAALVSQGRIRLMNVIALGVASAQTLVLAILAASGRLSVGVVVILWAAATITPVLPQFAALARDPGLTWPGRRTLGEVVMTGLRYHPGLVALALVLRVDILLLAPRVDVAELGIYSLAVTLVELALRATSASAQVAVQVQVRGEPAESADFTALVARVNAVIGTLAVAGLVLSGPWVIEAVFGPSFAGTAASLTVLAPGIVALSIQRPLGVFLTRLDHPLYVTTAMVIALAVNIVLNLLLIPVWGILGAAVASTVVYIGLLVWAAVWFSRASGHEWQFLVPSSADIRWILRSIGTKS